MSTINQSVHPFIIWTLQRTGGTNLTQRLTERSGLSGTEHEPFNPGRVFGHVTEQWLHDGDPEQLQRSVDEICQRGVVIKHCVETVPWEISEALVKASLKAGYRHLFLYRKNALDRLLSLHFAQKTGVWGPNMQTFVSLTGAREANTEACPDSVSKEAFGEPVPVEKLVSHEKLCVQALTRAWQALHGVDAQPWAVAYEDLYRAPDAEQPVRILLPLLEYLGMAGEEDTDRAWVAAVIGKGDQGTRDKYRAFPGVGELAKRITAVPPFLPDAEGVPIEARVVAEHHPWVERCFVDVLPAKVTPGESFELGGVILLTRDAPAGVVLQMEGLRRPATVQWGLPSQRMATQFPQGANAARARFVVQGASLQEDEDSLVLTLSAPGTEKLVVAEIIRSGPADYGRVYVEPEDRLIFDVGGNDGADTWYYLRKGFRVITVEAIPELAENLRNLFRVQIASGRLVVEEVAIAEHKGQVSFTINDESTEWSSAHGASKASLGSSRTITVPSTTLSALIARHGTPYYVKIDIEGGEMAAVESMAGLPPSELPPLVSFEINHRFGEILERLFDVGYRRFQLVRQGAPYLPRAPYPSREGLDYHCPFTSNMSGPFGDDLPPGKWVGLVEIIQRILQCRADMQSQKYRGEKPGWYDVHAVRLPGI